MNILIMGGPGAGKGTMSTKIVEKFHVDHISTGDIFRSEIGKQSTLGMMAKSYMDKGLLVPDDLVNDMVKSYFMHLEDKKRGYLLDGYPRTLEQVKAFDTLTKNTCLAVDKVLVLDIDFNILVGRITGRRICKDCGAIYHITAHPPRVAGVCDVCGGELYQRKDDTVESLHVRLDAYTKQTAPSLAFYKEMGIMYTIDANQNAQDAWADALRALEK